MVKELPRKCSCCGNNGHNSRTCNGNGKGCVKLFGVNISENKVDQSIKKSFSMGNLKAFCDEEHNDSNVGNVNGDVVGDDSGYLSDGLIHNKRRKDAHERKKGIPWTEEEHRTFLAGLKRLGKGNWREIARNFVTTRTPTQVASHAQKYFLRQSANDKKKRRSSLFDMHLKEPEVVCKTSPVSTATKGAEISSEEKASISQTLSLKNTTDSQQQVNAAKLVNRFPHLYLDSSPVVPVSAACCVPNYHPIPYLVGVPANVSFIPVMNFARRDISTQNVSATCAPTIGHPSGIPSSPKSFPHRITTHPDQSEKDGLGLELRIGQPQSTSAANLSSGAIIRVI